MCLCPNAASLLSRPSTCSSSEVQISGNSPQFINRLQEIILIPESAIIKRRFLASSEICVLPVIKKPSTFWLAALSICSTKS